MCINGLFEVNLVAIGIEDLVLQQLHGLVGDEPPCHAIAPPPLPVEAPEEPALANVRCYERMHVESEILHFHFGGQRVELLLQPVAEQDGGLDHVAATADGAGLGGLHVHDGTHALAGDLHQAELRERQDVVLGTVARHEFLDVLVELLAMLRLGKVDEIDHDDATHVAQAHLTTYLVGCCHIDQQGVLLLVLGLTAAMTGVDVDDMQGFGVLDDDVGTFLAGDGLSERRLDLARHRELIQNGLFLAIEFHDVRLFRGYQTHIILYLTKRRRVVDPDVLERGVKDVTK